MDSYHQIEGLLGKCASREVFLGFAPASLLYKISVADVLNEETRQGYQRRFDPKHSRDFRRYIQGVDATTIPLAFNLRPRNDRAWQLVSDGNGPVVLTVDSSCPDVMYQVDCQHRLGFLAGENIELAFMAFIGLEVGKEMEIFSVINGKAKGLSTSLLDYHDTQLAADLEQESPELFIALKLHEDERSPWHGQLDLGGVSTSGMKRRASLRTMKKASKRFLRETKCLKQISVPLAYRVLCDFWRAVAKALEPEWKKPRKHFITKGIGVYALSSVAGDLYIEAKFKGTAECDEAYFFAELVGFIDEFDWSNSGPLKGLGGEAGANEAVNMLRNVRNQRLLRSVASAK